MKLGFSSLLFICALLFACSTDDSSGPTPGGGGSGGGTGGGGGNNCDLSVPIYNNLTGNDLLQKVKECYTPTTSFTYADARDILYTDVDVIEGKLNTIYSGYAIEIDFTGYDNPRAAVFAAGINAEHVFPQSRGAGEEPARSDMFHLFPCLENVNSKRGNRRFDEIVDDMTDKWFYLQQEISNIPQGNRDVWSEGVGLDNSNGRWEPREDEKGDVARAVFYFVTIHNVVADGSYFETMKDQLLVWHEDDPVDDEEQTRNDRIKNHQGNDNPFIKDATLAERLFGN